MRVRADDGGARAAPVNGEAPASPISQPFRTILLGGEFWHGATERAVAQGFRNLGFNVQETPLLDHFLRSNDVALRLAARLLTPLGRRSYNSEILRAATIAEDGLFLTLKGSYVASETVRALQAGGMSAAVYYPDRVFGYPDVDEAVLRDADLVFTTKSFQMEHLDHLRGPGRTFLVHHGYSPLVHRPHWERVEEEDYLYDLAYVGSPDAYKAGWLSKLAGALPHRRMVIVGERWERFVGGTPLENCRLVGRITGDLMAEFVQRSRVNVAVHLGPGRGGWRDKVSTRTFEIPACKGFMLHEDNEEVRELFEPGAEIDVFGSADELCAKVEYYIERPELRMEMIERAYRRAVPAYSYHERAREMAAIAARELGR